MNHILIAGIDPGTTTGYAFFNSDGQLIFKGSQKELGINQLISLAHSKGQIIVVGTDKAKIPSLVSAFAIEFGAEIFHPKMDLSILEKKKIAKGLTGENSHESDAISAGLFAYKKIKGLLFRVRKFLRKQNKEDLFDDLTRFVMQKNISIQGSYDILTAPDEVKKIVIKEKKDSKIIARLSNKIIEYKENIIDLEEQEKEHILQLSKLRQKLKQSETNALKLRQKRKSTYDKKYEEIIKKLYRQLLDRDKSIKNYSKVNEKLHQIIQKSHNKIFVQKLKNIAKIGKIENKYLFIDNPNEYSKSCVENLKDKTIFFNRVLSKKSMSILRENKVRTIRGIKLHEESGTYYVIKRDVEAKTKSSEHLKDIIKEYKQERDSKFSKN